MCLNQKMQSLQKIVHTLSFGFSNYNFHILKKCVFDEYNNKAYSWTKIM